MNLGGLANNMRQAQEGEIVICDDNYNSCRLNLGSVCRSYRADTEMGNKDATTEPSETPEISVSSVAS
jgi:hypothetical protein